MKKFALIGASGYIAPRHMKAINETHNDLVAAVDKSDSVGIIDNYFSQAAFFTEFERFDRHLEKLKRLGNMVDYVSVCSPNYLHDAHIRFGLRYGADVICEKPTVLNPWNLDALEQLQNESEGHVYNILQLRLHPEIVALRKFIESSDPNKIYDIDLTYITSRGHWYYASWKGDLSKSGGIASNIGIHFFDMLQWIFGPVKSNKVNIQTHDRVAGFLELEKARVRWFLSINSETLPPEIKSKNQTTYRSVKINEDELEFSTGFTDLHTVSYNHILKGDGYTIDEVRPSIELVHDIRVATPMGLVGDYHPFCKLPLSKHPFKNNDKY